MAGILLRLEALYKKEGGAFPDPILNLNWPYELAEAPRPDELAREINGYTLADVNDATGPSSRRASSSTASPS